MLFDTGLSNVILDMSFQVREAKAKINGTEGPSSQGYGFSSSHVWM